MGAQLHTGDAAGDGGTDRQCAVEMVGQISRIRRTERAGGSHRPVPLSDLAGTDPRHDLRRRLQRLPEEKRGEPPASGNWLQRKRSRRLQAYLSCCNSSSYFNTLNFIIFTKSS